MSAPAHRPSLPFPVALLLAALAVGLAAGLDGSALLAAFGAGFGRQQGYFALILLPSFFLAAALSRGEAPSLGRAGVALAPLAGAGMVCPDTAYATLAPVTPGHRRAVAVGAYAGFKLLLPAGPLLIGVALAADVASPRFALAGLALLVPVGAAGLAWLRLAAPEPAAPADPPAAGRAGLRRLLPLALLGGLLGAGFLLRPAAPLLAFATSPVGALLAASAATAALLPGEQRRECLDAALRRTAPLLLTLGAAAALGGLLAEALPLRDWAARAASGHSALGLVLLLFGVTAAFKMVNGSSMATFAAVPPVLAPVVAAAGLDRTVATYAICLGSFVAVLPNDSFFWVTQPPSEGGPRATDLALAGASAVQGFTGLALLSAALLAWPGLR